MAERYGIFSIHWQFIPFIGSSFLTTSDVWAASDLMRLLLAVIVGNAPPAMLSTNLAITV